MIMELSITRNYVPAWGLLDAAREILQNAQDEVEANPDHPMRVRYSARQQRLTITSEGVVLDRAVLLLGQTSKRGTGARGQFGEGLDLALLSLVRANHPLRIENGMESWIPDLRYSEAWGQQVLVIETRRLQTPRNHFMVQIDAVSQEDWDTIVSRTLFLPGSLPRDEPVIAVGEHKVLPTRPGRVYVRGIWVADVPNLSCGYDLAHAEIDRDRRLIDPWRLRTTVAEIWADAAMASREHVDRIWQMLRINAEDTRGLANQIQYGYGANATRIKNAVTEAWTERHGDSVPVSSTQDAERADAAGIPAVLTTPAEAEVVNAATGRTLAIKLAEKATTYSRKWGVADLTAAPAHIRTRWATVCEIAHVIVGGRTPLPISIAEMHSADTMGLFTGGEVILADHLLSRDTPGEALITLAHEMAHAHGGDLSLGHRDAAEVYAGRVIDYIAAMGANWPQGAEDP